MDQLHCLRALIKEDDGADDEDISGMKPTRKERVEKQAMVIVTEFISGNQLKKDELYVYMPRENYQWDYEVMQYAGRNMTFSGLINHLHAT
eukprot:COSAG05_NODE_7181_length_845_cov_4.085791_2_plen_91_part_00